MSVKAVDGNGFTKLCYTTTMNFPYSLLFTCHNFDLGKLRSGVAWTVLAAALGEKNVCDYIPEEGNVNANPLDGGGYNWTVQTGSKLIYAAKKSGKPTPTDYDFKIEFSGGNGENPGPRVWVEDAEKASCDAVSLPEESLYTSYNLHLIINGNDCTQSYGVADKTELSRALKGKDVPAAFLGSCLATSYACYAATAVATGGIDAVVDAVTGAGIQPIIECGLGSAAVGLMAFMGPDLEASQGVPAIPAIVFGGLAAYKYHNLVRDKAAYDLAQKIITIPYGTPGVEILTGKTADDILKELGKSPNNLDNYKKEVKSGLKKLRRIAKALGDDDTVRQIDNLIEEIDNAKKVGEFETVLKKIDNVLNITKINNLRNLINKQLQNLKKNPSAICSHIGMATAVATTSLFVMGQAMDVDFLNVAINPAAVATFEIKMPALPNEACISVGGAECPRMR